MYIAHLQVLHHEIPPSQLAYALNGAVVGLIADPADPPPSTPLHTPATSNPTLRTPTDPVDGPPTQLHMTCMPLCGGHSPDNPTSKTLDVSQSAPTPAGPLACLGVGIVRSIDVRRGLLYVVAPLEEAEMERVTALHLGSLELPPPLLQGGGCDGGVSPYLSTWSLPLDGSGSGAMRSRNNLARAGLQP